MKIPGAFCLVICAALGLNAQGDFEELSQRAAAALESNPAEAAKLYQQAVALRPSWAEGWFYLAASLYGEKQYGESQKAFQRAAQLAPENGTVWAFLGLCEYQMGVYPEALRDIRKGEGAGLGADKQFISSIRNHAALIYLRDSNFGGAMEQLEPLARLGDDSPATIENLGVGALGAPYVPPQVPVEKKALIELAGRAAWALSRQRADEARPFLDELKTKYPNEPGVHYLYGLSLTAEAPEAAMKEFRRELEIRPSHVPARLQAALLDIKAGKPESALQLAQAAVQLQPGNPYCQLTLGRAYLSMGQAAKAIPAFREAVRLGPENPQPHFYLAQIYSRTGRVAEAEKEQDEYKRLKTAQQPVIF
jgi:tetratricopeptide (TPR) repeat protein